MTHGCAQLGDAALTLLTHGCARLGDARLTLLTHGYAQLGDGRLILLTNSCAKMQRPGGGCAGLVPDRALEISLRLFECSALVSAGSALQNGSAQL